MTQPIAFIGGIHGVGKGTLCNYLAQKCEYKHLVASELLNWSELVEDTKVKSVYDVVNTQNRLILGLRRVISRQFKYILDGHFCLVNRAGQFEQVPLDTFLQIAPFSLNLIIDDPLNIQERLKSRDNKIYDKEWLAEFQEAEISNARSIAHNSGINLNICPTSDISPITETLLNFKL